MDSLEIKNNLLLYIETLRTDESTKTVCKKLSDKLNVSVEEIKSIMDYLEYENLISYIKVKHSGLVYVTPKIVKPNKDIVTEIFNKTT